MRSDMHRIKRRRTTPPTDDNNAVAQNGFASRQHEKSTTPYGKKKDSLASPATYEAEKLPMTRSSKEKACNDSVKEQVQQISQRNSGATPRYHEVRSSEEQNMVLKCEQMLQRINTMRNEKAAQLELHLNHLEETIESIPSFGPLRMQDAQRFIHELGIAIPYIPSKTPDHDEITMTFGSPARVELIGSYVYKTTSDVHKQLTADMIVLMPSENFHDKDFLDHRYFRKRAIYLARIAAGITTSSSANYKVQYCLKDDNFLLPVIDIYPYAEDGSYGTVKIRILPGLELERFPLRKTLPNRQCVRTSSKSDDISSSAVPTPFYNASVRHDSSYMYFSQLIRNANAKCSGFRKASILGGVWLRQRGFSTSVSQGGFGAFEWSILLALLLNGGKNEANAESFSDALDAHQLFRAMINLLARRDLTRQILRFHSDHNALRQERMPIVFDGLAGMNVLFKMNPYSYSLLKQEAQISLKTLNNRNADDFDSLFILKIDEPLTKWDALFNVPLDRLSIPGWDTGQVPLEPCDLIAKALGNRITNLSVTYEAVPPWDVTDDISNGTLSRNLILKLSLDGENMFRTVDRGPAAEEVAEVAKFRQLWGDKAELRKFKDGSIQMSVIWSKNDPIDLVEEIVEHLVATHYSSNAHKKQFQLTISHIVHSLQQPLSLEPYAPLLDSFNVLQRTLHSLKDLPLPIQQVQASSSKLGFVADVKRLYNSPVDIIIQFESSARWPDDLEAIQATKIAFLLKVQELLQASLPQCSIKIGIENDTCTLHNQSYLQVAFSPGATFHVRIHHDREILLLKKTLTNGETRPSEREAAASALAAYKRDYIVRPLHTQATRNLATRYGAFSATVRLVKAWFESQMLTNHICDELTEVLVMNTFAHLQSWLTPSTASVGFFRTLLYLSRWDWQHYPLIVDPEGSLTSAERTEIYTRFRAWRKIDSGLHRVAVFAATSYDQDGTTWTADKLSKVVMSRVTRLAQAVCKRVSEQSLQLNLDDLFKVSNKDYDFLICLNPRLCSTNGHKISTVYKNLEQAGSQERQQHTESSLASVFLNDIEKVYGDVMILFPDIQNSNTCAGIWNPQMKNRQWKANLPFSTAPGGLNSNNFKTVHLNRRAIMSEIGRLGGELVKEILSLRAE